MSKRKTRIGSNPLSWITNTKKKLSGRQKTVSEPEPMAPAQDPPPMEVAPPVEREVGTQGTGGYKNRYDDRLIYFKREWSEVPSAVGNGAENADERVLVICFERTLPPRLSEHLFGRSTTVVTAGDSFSKTGDKRYEMDLANEDSFGRLLGKGGELGDLPCKIVLLWTAGEFSQNDVDGQLRRYVVPVFYLLRELLKRRLEQSVTVMMAIEYRGRISPLAAALSGLFRTVRRENPQLVCKCVFVPDMNEWKEGIWAELDAGESADLEIMVRDRKRFRGTFRELVPDGASPSFIKIEENGVYIVTGGTGGLGLVMAGHLATFRGVKLVLTDVRELSDDTRERIEMLKRVGADVLFLQCDVTNEASVRDMARRAREKFGSIDGVIHSAGVTRDAFLINKTGADIAGVLAPKIFGAMALDAALENEPLQFFILFSSLSAALGSPGQSDYSYANCFLDHFAQWRRDLMDCGERHGRTISINWPFWADGGMRISQETREAAFDRTGLDAMPTAAGIEAFDRVLGSGEAGVVVAYGDPEKLKALITGSHPEAKRELPARKQGGRPDVNPAELLEKATAFLKNIFCELLKLQPRYVGMDVRFEEFGIDSIMVNLFNAKIDKTFRNIPKTLLFEYETLRELSDYFVRHQKEALLDIFYGGQAGSPAPTISSATAKRPKLTSLKEKGGIGSRISGVCVAGASGIAVIGVSGRYPGARDIGEFWENIEGGKDCIGEIPIDRWDYRPYYDPDPANGKIYCKRGGFIDGVDLFDPLSFNISPREAANMDPQERLFLEASRDALQDAGYNQREIKRMLGDDSGPGVGVFVGVTTFTYQLLRPDMGQQLPAPSSIANRVSFVLNLNGPSMPVDTACSSSLTAIHVACESIQRGECRMAIAGGVNLYLHPAKYLTMCSFKMLSPKGKCHTFSADADGFVPGEGVGAVLLKPLEQAVADRDYIYGVIKGTAVNHGGRTNGYSVPSPNAQGALIKTALEKSGIDPRTISYVEAHGTGTSLGDPIEISGLMKAFSQYTKDRHFCAVGSVKTNIGHLESAAGIAALTKILLQMKYRRLVPSLHAEELNPKIDFENSCFVVQRALEPWLRPQVTRGGVTETAPRRAAVSSFGAWGANAHIIVEEFPQEWRRSSMEQKKCIIVLSARKKEYLAGYARILSDFLRRSKTEAQPLTIGDQSLERRVAVQLCGLAAGILSIDANEIRPEEELSDYGFEPMHMMELIGAINELWKIDLPLAVVAGHTEPASLASILCRDYGDAVAKTYRKKSEQRDDDGDPGFIPALSDIAFTLQTGREPLDERLAFVASSLDELEAKLLNFSTGTGDDACFVGNVRDYKTLSQYLLGGEAGDDFLDILLDRQDYGRIAQLWVTGVDIDWYRCYPEIGARPRRIPLPAYPLARQRYWVDGPSLPQAAAGLHPLLDSVHFPLSMDQGIVFQKKLGPGDPIIRDHRVAGRGILPGVGYLEIAYAALSQVRKAGDYTMRNVILLLPLAVEDNPKQVLAALKERDQTISFEIKSLEGGQETLHARGEFRKKSATGDSSSRKVAIGDIKARCNRVLDGRQLYEGYDGIGISYGPFFQGVEQVCVNGDEAVGSLAISPSARSDWRSYLLHPTLMDGALQTLAGLVQDPQAANCGPMLPFSFDTVELTRSPGERAFAYVKKAGGQHRYHVAIVDEEGGVCVTLQDVALRELKHPSSASRAEDSFEKFFYSPRWTPRPLAEGEALSPGGESGVVLLVTSPFAASLAEEIAGFYPDSQVKSIDSCDVQSLEKMLPELQNLKKIYFLGGVADVEHGLAGAEALAEAQDRGVLALFRLVKILGKEGFSRHRLSVTVVTNRALAIGSGEVNPTSAALHGFTGSMAKEYTQWDVNCIDIDTGTGPAMMAASREMAGRVVCEPPSRSGDIVVYRGAVRYAREIELLSLPAPESSPFKKQGVYVIAGGAGGIGLELSEYLAKQVQARLVLLGRSQTSDALQTRIAAIEAHGGEVLYIQTDITDPGSVRQALAKTRERFGSVAGVIHSAIVLRDRIIENMDEETFLAALKPKVRGSFVLYDVFRSEPLDFMMFFSSAQAITCNAGQSNYAAGCAFKDAFAHYIAKQSSFPVKIVNWGYWGSVGVVSSSEYNQRLSSRGIESILPEEGMEAVRRILAGPVSQVIPFKADTGMLAAMGIDLQKSRFYQKATIPAVLEKALSGEIVASTDEGGDNQVDASAAVALHEFMGLSLLAAFRRMGVFRDSSERYNRQALCDCLKIQPQYYKLFNALLAILNEHGFIEQKKEHIIASGLLDRKEVKTGIGNLEETRIQLSGRFPEIAPHLRLVTVCLEAYPDVLTGGRDAVSVMFPQGSMELVEDVYKGNEIVDFNNRRMAAIIANAVAIRLKEDSSARIRLLEIGAGTGGTTGTVCSAIQSFGASIEYVYTDISKKFVQHGRAAFGSLYPFMEFQALDIEQNPEAQGFAIAGFDIALATNVIHATQDIGVTLGNIKQLMKTNGLLLINEATKKQDFGTLTFGLTDGWWLFRDDEVRIPGTPLLSVSSWRAMMEICGFRGVRAFGLASDEGSDAEQSVIVGEGDGGVILTRSLQPWIEAKKAPAAAARRTSLPQATIGASRIEDTIMDVLARVIGIDRKEFDPHLSFQDYGVDSLLAVEIIDAINSALTTELRPTDLFNYATIRDLGNHIKEKAVSMESIGDGSGNGESPYDVEASIRDILAEVIHIDSSQFDPDMSFQDYGVDSLLAVEIIDKINGKLGLSLRPTDLFNYATLRDLARHIAPLASASHEEVPLPPVNVPELFSSTVPEEPPQEDDLMRLLRQLENGELSAAEAERFMETYHG